MRIAIAGNSGHVSYVLDALALDTTLTLVSVCPVEQGESMESLMGMLKRIGHAPKVYLHVEEMLQTEQLDILVCASAFYLNFSLSMLALKRGLAVFCEKPLALTLEDLKELQTAHHATNLPICAMLGIRNQPGFAAAKRLVETGALGEILMITAQKSYKLGTDRPAFYRRRETYGGTISWVGIHAIDWCLWLGGKKFTHVLAQQQRMGNHHLGELESCALVQYTLEGGGMAGVNIDYLRPDCAPTHGDDRVRIVGTGGVLEVSAGIATYLPQEGEAQVLPLLPCKGIFEEFVAYLRGTGANPVPTEQGIYGTAAAILAQESADTGKIVRFAEYGW